MLPIDHVSLTITPPQLSRADSKSGTQIQDYSPVFFKKEFITLLLRKQARYNHLLGLPTTIPTKG